MLNAAIVGLGRWGRRLVESVADSDRIRFTVGVTRDPTRAAGYGRSAGLELTDSYASVLGDARIGAVVLATPHSQHAAEIAAAAEAGKHVFVEKPMALTGASAAAAAAACERAGVVLGHGFGRRFAPAYLGLREAVESGAIGELLHLEGQFSGPTGHGLKPGFWRSTRAEAPGGGMTGRGIHALDGMIGLAGPVAQVFAYCDRRQVAVDMDDTTSVLLRFASGQTGYLGCVFVTADYWRIQAIGTKGWAEMRGELQLVVRDLTGTTRTADYLARDIERAGLEAFAGAVVGDGEFPVAPRQAVNGIAVLEAIVGSAGANRPVDIA